MNVLIVHEDPRVREHITRLCRKGVLAAATCIAAASAETCLRSLREVEIDLIITDPDLIALPVEDLVEAVAELPCRAPVIVYGVVRDRQRRVDLAEGGVSGFLGPLASHRALDGIALSVLAPYVGRLTSAA